MDNKNIKQYLIENEIDRSCKDPYGEVADRFGTDRETIRVIYKSLRKKGLVEKNKINSFGNSQSTQAISFNKEEVQINTVANKEITSLQDLAKVCKIDLHKWDIVKGECKKREVLNNENGNRYYRPIFAVSATIKPKKIEGDREAQLEVLKKVLGESRKSELGKHIYTRIPSKEKKELLYEISIPDIHFGKLAHRDEAGEDYDIKIATARYRDAVTELLEAVDLTKVGRILLPVGNDMVHIDSRRSETFEGTRQDSDSRFYKIVKTVKNILIETIDRLSLIAPVDVLVIPGNHDPESMFMIGEMLDAYYHNSDEVSVDNTPKQRKFYHFFKNGFMYTHGNEENHRDLGLIFATERPDLWAKTEFRAIKLGHLHKRKKVEFTSVEEYTGFIVQILPSLCGSDAWHYSKGYMSKKGAKGFLYHPTKGLIAETNHNI